MKKPLPPARGLSLAFLLAAGLTCAGGCATYQVRIPDSDPITETYQGRTVHAVAWGAWYAPQVSTADCAGEGINDVRIKRNLLHDMASVLTFGFWMPIEVEFRCKAPLPVIDEFP